MRLADYDPCWTRMFEAEAARMRGALGDLARRIEHVGSTSVAGLAAKPIIDIQLSVPSVQPMDPYKPKLEALGYTHVPMPDLGEEYPFFLRPPSWPTTHHVHVCTHAGQQEQRHLAFRDWLRAHPQDRDAYAALKRQLAEKADPSDLKSMFAYTEGKTDFVRGIEERALGAPHGSW